ncbi:hypothetical protein NC653_027253 [Populus alba x Populus x berolinensis]|uniref:Uncharacterized protein n=1 Tax=Populus alba x Populus x berolinensis TaxID=444605 RepID=A0AAD6M4X1_9ROSI|nr:hypothetical protein NC653_027253 [Populus alba x Populus x berolinensis]
MNLGFDLIAFALAVTAEQRRNTATTEKIGNDKYRHYDSDIATGLGVSALLFLMASQLLIVVGWSMLVLWEGYET